ncbi:plasmid pRiA4b ORF-3 family protein [Methylobacterium tarhaniae]|uniref:plasmid pRiA4b ORF-3 family protein n=1 Tax=Methylobacterium tarhaniae TaxID=1187852 RepID=UPI003D0335E0
MSHTDSIARLRVELNDTMPVIWRIVEVPLTMSLSGLHEVVQAAMPFENCHLYEFRIGGRRYALPDPDFPDPEVYSPKVAKLGAALEGDVRRFTYIYDFGDNWQHTITVEALSPADPALHYPRFVDGGRRAPPEDVGGTMGFEEFLNVLSKPRHRERKAMLEWCGGSFDPDTIPIDIIVERVEKLARSRRTRKAASRKSRGLEQ